MVQEETPRNLVLQGRDESSRLRHQQMNPQLNELRLMRTKEAVMMRCLTGILLLKSMASGGG